MNTEVNPKEYFEEIGLWPQGSRHVLSVYVAGLGLSLLLTLAAYLLATRAAFSPMVLMVALLTLACVQFAAQVVCFLHISLDSLSRERLLALCAAVVVVFILVAGSLWIMLTLNARMMPGTAQMEQYMQRQAGI